VGFIGGERNISPLQKREKNSNSTIERLNPPDPSPKRFRISFIKSSITLLAARKDSKINLTSPS